MTTTHHHRATDTSRETVYWDCVDPHGISNAAHYDAHGGIHYVEKCDCGAQRHVNNNLGVVEHSAWRR